MNNVVGILAMIPGGVIGVDDKMAWKHCGDFKRFKRLTTGHALLLGMRTFLGMITHHTATGSMFLPGRRVFVIGDHRAGDLSQQIGQRQREREITGDITMVSSTGDPGIDLARITQSLFPGQLLFVAGGNRIYTSYLPHASKIFLTLINPLVDIDRNGMIVQLAPEVHTWLTNLMLIGERVNTEVEEQATATYYEITP